MRITIKMNTRLRLISLALLATTLILFPWFALEYIHFINHPIFDHASLAGPPTNKTPNYFKNILLISLFFLQHYIMADLTFKKTMSKIFALFPVFERYVFNIVAELLFVFALSHMDVSNQPIIVLPKAVYLFGVLGWPIFIVSQLQMAFNLLLPFPLKDILYADSLTMQIEPAQKRRGLLAEGLYKLCRNPMYSGLMMTLLGASRVVTIDRILFNTSIFIGIIYGVKRQEAKMKLEFEDYDEYVKKIPNRYVPIFSNIGKTL